MHAQQSGGLRVIKGMLSAHTGFHNSAQHRFAGKQHHHVHRIEIHANTM